MKFINVLVVLIFLLFSASRVMVPFQPLSWLGAYKDFAHIFVGFLLAGWIYSRNSLFGQFLLFLTIEEVVVGTLGALHH